MPSNKKDAVTYGAAWVTRLDPYAPGLPTSLPLWIYGVPLDIWENLERASGSHPRQTAPRRVPRRANGNSLPLLGLRPAMKLKRPYMRLEGVSF
jgi:hypothetical protein